MTHVKIYEDFIHSKKVYDMHEIKKSDKRYQLIKKIQSVLTDDLLIPYWLKQRSDDEHPTFGHCYAASEALYHMLGGKSAGYKPMRATTPGGTHWWIVDKNGTILDPTAEQFTYKGITPPYNSGIGAGFLTKQPSKRARKIMKRVMEL